MATTNVSSSGHVGTGGGSGDSGQAPKAAFKQVNPDDNPVDKDGKTARDKQLEKMQAKKTADAQPEFAPIGGAKGDAGTEFAAAAARIDPRNEVHSAPARPPVPGVDQFHGGSSVGSGGYDPQRAGGRDPGQPTHPLPNPNNPDSPNNPVSTAYRDLIASQPTPPAPTGARTTTETPMSGSSPAQDEAKEQEEKKPRKMSRGKQAKANDDRDAQRQQHRPVARKSAARSKARAKR